jgi:hypothetical protein
MIGKCWNKYLYYLEKYPIRTKCLTSCAIFSTSEVISQVILPEKSGKFNYGRVVKMGLFGLCFHGLFFHHYFKFLEKLFHGKHSFIKKLVFDQVFCAPFINFVIITYSKMYDGETFQNVIDFLKKEFTQILLANYYLWPAAQALNFKVIPINLRVLFNNMVGLLWVTILSLMVANKN